MSLLAAADAMSTQTNKHLPDTSDAGFPGFLHVRENWEMSGNLSGQGKVSGKYILDKSGKSQGK